MIDKQILDNVFTTLRVLQNMFQQQQAVLNEARKQIIKTQEYTIMLQKRIEKLEGVTNDTEQC